METDMDEARRVEALDQNMQHLANVIKTQCSPGTYDQNPYTLGLANGLLLAQGILMGTSPQFLEAPRDGYLALREGHPPLKTGEEVKKDFIDMNISHTQKRMQEEDALMQEFDEYRDAVEDVKVKVENGSPVQEEKSSVVMWPKGTEDFEGEAPEDRLQSIEEISKGMMKDIQENGVGDLKTVSDMLNTLQDALKGKEKELGGILNQLKGIKMP